MTEADRVARGLTEDLQVARISAAVTYRLRDMWRERSPLVRLAEEFTWLSMSNCRQSAIVHLWKAVDTDKRALSIPWFIRNHSLLSDADKSTDIGRLSTKNDVVKRLCRLRHQVFAHRGSETGGKRADEIVLENNISESEFQGLIAEALSVLQRHLGRPLTRSLDLSEAGTIGELADLDAFLHGTLKGRSGIERLVLEIDGASRAPLVEWQPRLAL